MSDLDEIKRHLKTFLGDVRRDTVYNTVNDDARVEELLQILISDGFVIKVYSGNSKQSIWCDGYEIAAKEPLVNGSEKGS